MNGKKLAKRIEQIRARDPKVVVTYNRERSAIAILRGKLAPPVNVAKLRESPHDHARRFIRKNKALLGDIDEKMELSDHRAITGSGGMTHVTFCQNYGRAQVYGARVSIHYADDGSVCLLKSNLASSIDVPKCPRVTRARAGQIARRHAGRGATLFRTGKPALVVASAETVYREEKGKGYCLCWRLGIVPPEKSGDPHWIYFVDAINGKVLLRHSADQTGTGAGYYSTGTSLISVAEDGTYKLRDGMTSKRWPTALEPKIHTYDDADLPFRLLRDYSEDADDNWDDIGPLPGNRCDRQCVEVDAHRFAGYAMDYFGVVHERYGWNGLGGDLLVHVHNKWDEPDTMPNNAFWGIDDEMYIGDGDRTSDDDEEHYDFMCTLNVVAHEFAHAVNDGFDVVQSYYGETGAVNEAIADLFGYLIARQYPADEPHPHIIAQCMPGGRARNMADPSRDDQGVVGYNPTDDDTKFASKEIGFCPDHYDIRYRGYEDDSGVHTNCPILTHAVYLMMHGGTHRLSGTAVTGIGVAPVEKMLYAAVSTGQLTETSRFIDFRTAMIQACMSLEGYPENLDYLTTVRKAFQAVGVGPDLYIRDRLDDQGEEPGSFSCASPDIIVRKQKWDPDKLDQLKDVNNASLSEEIESGSHDHYVYFRIFNRGSVPASGTFRLFLTDASGCSPPDTWDEVNHFDFSEVPEQEKGQHGLWTPGNQDECITLPATQINSHGGACCLVGIIESNEDPPPDPGLIDPFTGFRFHEFIGESNNCAWRNIMYLLVDLLKDSLMEVELLRYNGIGPGPLLRPSELLRQLEIDTRDLLKETRLVLWIPRIRVGGISAFEARLTRETMRPRKIAGILDGLAEGKTEVRPIPISDLARIENVRELVPDGLREDEVRRLCPLSIPPGRVIRLGGLDLEKGESMDIRFAVQFPKDTSKREVSLAFRERVKQGQIGQMNYIFQFRKGGR